MYLFFLVYANFLAWSYYAFKYRQKTQICWSKVLKLINYWSKNFITIDLACERIYLGCTNYQIQIWQLATKIMKFRNSLTEEKLPRKF